MMRNQHVRGFKFRNSNRIVFIYEEEFTLDFPSKVQTGSCWVVFQSRFENCSNLTLILSKIILT